MWGSVEGRSQRIWIPRVSLTQLGQFSALNTPGGKGRAASSKSHWAKTKVSTSEPFPVPVKPPPSLSTDAADAVRAEGTELLHPNKSSTPTSSLATFPGAQCWAPCWSASSRGKTRKTGTTLKKDPDPIHMHPWCSLVFWGRAPHGESNPCIPHLGQMWDKHWNCFGHAKGSHSHF